MKSNLYREDTDAIHRNWDLFRYALVVARAGSYSGAARILRQSPPTVSRRLKALEDAIGCRLFDRRADGAFMTAEGEAVLAAVERMEREAIAIDEAIRNRDNSHSGVVQIAAPCGLGSLVLSQEIGRFVRAHPKIRVDLRLGADRVNILNREADIAIRIGDPGQLSLVGRKLGRVQFRLYASADYLSCREMPKEVGELEDHDLIDSSGSLEGSIQSRTLRMLVPRARRTFTAENIVAQALAARQGLGIVALPRYIGDSDSDLMPIFVDGFHCAAECWLLSHPDLTSVARVRAVMDFLSDASKPALMA